jgi:hypothetical protein
LALCLHRFHMLRLNHLWIKNIPRKNCVCTEHTHFFLVIPYTIQCNSYLPIIYVVLGIISNLESVQSIYEDVYWFIQVFTILYEGLEHAYFGI